MKKGRYEPTPILCYYNGKVVDMNYVPDPKMRFSIACYRISDNNAKGYVIADNKVYFITPYKRSAKVVLGEERERVLAEVAALPVTPREERKPLVP